MSRGRCQPPVRLRNLGVLECGFVNWPDHAGTDRGSHQEGTAQTPITKLWTGAHRKRRREPTARAFMEPTNMHLAVWVSFVWGSYCINVPD